MDWNNLKTSGDSPQKAFETLCNHLFEQYLWQKYNNELTKFRVINGAGGDGGIEAYGELISGIYLVSCSLFTGLLGRLYSKKTQKRRKRNYQRLYPNNRHSESSRITSEEVSILNTLKVPVW